MEFTQIKKLLHDSIGLDSSTVGDSSIERAINCRANILGLTCASSYLSYLKNTPDELDELVEEVVVPETWFFRNLVPFNILADFLSEHCNNYINLSKPLRILSVPCSTGEEPYSIAIALMEANFSNCDFKIDAVDISKRAITKARRAIYGKNSFRESGIDIREKYFKRSRSGARLLPEVRAHVNFIQANLLGDDSFPGLGDYDIIFCRNLLIYFDNKTQKKVFKKLHSMLKPDGALFVGHAEAAKVSNKLFKRIDAPKAFAFRKVSSVLDSIPEELSNTEQINNQDVIFDQLSKVAKKDLRLAKGRNAKSVRKVAEKAGPENDWGEIARLIKAGELYEASALCESLLAKDPEIADGYYYIGLIANLGGNSRSADLLLKKALYLDPHHFKALGLSALLAEQRGDVDQAIYLRRRESRVRKRK